MNARTEFNRLVGQLEPAIETAFLNAVATVAGNVPFAEVVSHFKRGDIEAAIEAMDLTPGAFSQLTSTITGAYQTAGASAAAQTGRQRRGFKIGFDSGDPDIENFIRNNTGKLIVEIADDARAGVRQVLTEAFGAGRNPTTTVQQVVGKINRATGKREGGIIGLTGKQQGWVDNARRELEALDPGYFDRKARDKRHDKKVRNAIKNKKPLTPSDVDKITANYKNKLLKERGKTIALTETMTAINSTKMFLFAQAAKKNKIKLEWVDKVWKSSHDARVRQSHRQMDEQTRKFRQKFNSPSGATLDYPADPNAPAAERIRCRCWLHLTINYDRMYGIEDD